MGFNSGQISLIGAGFVIMGLFGSLTAGKVLDKTGAYIKLLRLVTTFSLIMIVVVSVSLKLPFGLVVFLIFLFLYLKCSLEDQCSQNYKEHFDLKNFVNLINKIF